MAKIKVADSEIIFDEKREFEIANDLCTGCGLCMIACNYIKNRRFGFADAYVKVTRVGTQESFSVAFTDECDSCGFCLNYCGYEAIRKPDQARSLFVRASHLKVKKTISV